MLFINKENIENISMDLIQSGVEKAYKIMLKKNYNMPDRMHLNDNENTLLLMPCFSENYFATKLVSIFPKAFDHNLPVVNGVLVLADNTSGRPVAIMDGAAVTAQRTGAVGGLGVKYLARENLSSAGIFGAGVQGFNQSKYLIHNRKIKTLYIKDLNLDKAKHMAEKLSKLYSKVDFIPLNNANELVEKSELIITATTSNEPLFDDNSANIDSKVFIGIGSYTPGMKEFPDCVISSATKVYVDTFFALKESGDISIPLENKVIDQDKIKEFATLLTDKCFSRKGVLMFKSVGMALFDLVVASLIYETACKENIGQKLNI